jgi:hypothetical protein
MPVSDWHPLSELREQLELNLASLARRDAELTAQLRAIDTPDYHICGDVNRILLGRATGPQVQPLPNPVTPAAAAQIAAKLFPNSQCSEPTLVAGLDHGWLWQKLYDLETHCPRTPGHRPPLYFLARDLDRLWAVLHFHDWAKLLSDPRVRLFAGADAVEQAMRSLAQNPLVPWPKFCVTVDPTIWPSGSNIDSMLRVAHESIAPRMNQLTRQLNALDASIDPMQLASRF